MTTPTPADASWLSRRVVQNTDSSAQVQGFRTVLSWRDHHHRCHTIGDDLPPGYVAMPAAEPEPTIPADLRAEMAEATAHDLQGQLQAAGDLLREKLGWDAGTVQVEIARRRKGMTTLARGRE